MTELLTATEWRSPPTHPRLAPDQVHVWRIQLDVTADTLARRYLTLAPDEQARAARYRRPTDRDRFVAARGALRGILGRYLGVSARAIRFDYGPHGKPALMSGLTPSQPALTFSLAHSRSLALCAVADGCALGIDIEWVQPALAQERIAERFFATGEVATLRSLPASEQPLAFFRCWTRKEAFVKALGQGLMYPLNRFEVSLAPTEPPALLSVADAPAEAAAWSLSELLPAPGYVAALAVARHGWWLETWGDDDGDFASLDDMNVTLMPR